MPRSPATAEGHGQWHHVELFCAECDAWRQSGAASTREGFELQGRALVGGRCVLKPCGHLVVAKAEEARFGGQIAQFYGDG